MVVTNSYGDRVILKEVVHQSMTIADVLTNTDTAFLPGAATSGALSPDLPLSPGHA